MNPVVFLSAGVDSLVTLYFVREKQDVPVIVYASDWTKEQIKQLERLIFDWNLTAYIYPPKHRYFMGDMSLVDEYGFGSLTIPVVRDVGQGTRCAFTLDEKRHDGFNLGWDTVYTGNLKTDRHYSGIPALSNEPECIVNGIKFIAPLYNWTKSAVERTARALQIDKYVIEDSGDINLCSACMKGERVFCPLEQKIIEPVNYDGQAMLKAFQKKYFEV